MVAEVGAVAPGKPFEVAITLRIEKGWHVYWSNPGDTGVPTSVSWTLPKGWKASPLRFPTPSRMEAVGLAAFGYENSLVLLTTLTPPPNAVQGTTPKLSAKVAWLACIEEMCVGGSKVVSTTVKVAAKSGSATHKAEALFISARKNLPKPLTGMTVTAKATASGTTLVVRGRPGAKSAFFFPEGAEMASASSPQAFRATTGGFELDLRKSEYANRPPKKMSGILVISPHQGRRLSYLVNTAIQ